MDYNTSNLFFQNIVQSIVENKLIAAVVWIVFMIFILRKIAKKDYGGIEIDEGPWQEIVNPNNGKKIIIKDVICDAFLQQILLRPTEYDVNPKKRSNKIRRGTKYLALIGIGGKRSIS